MWWVVLIVLIVLIILAIEYWQVTLALTGIGVISYILYIYNKSEQAKEAARKREEEARRREEEQRQAEQRSIHATLANIVSDSKKAASELSNLVWTAEQSLNDAEHEFREGAFAPFWDTVEKAAFQLATFNSHIQLLDLKALDYRDGVSRLSGSAPPFELGIRSLPNATRTAERMRTIVRQAQKDFHFAAIYEQRKTRAHFKT